jgi:hypothetical protein
MIPGRQGRWRDEAGYKAVTQGWWALGAVLGSFFGAQIAAWLSRRRACAFTCRRDGAHANYVPRHGVSVLPAGRRPRDSWLLFFGWLPLYLPELFPTRRAAGSGIACNVGRFATAVGDLRPACVHRARQVPGVGAICGLIYCSAPSSAGAGYKKSLITNNMLKVL